MKQGGWRLRQWRSVRQPLRSTKWPFKEEKLRIMSEEARNKTLKQEQKIMFMDSSCLDDDQKAYVSAMRAQILIA